MRVKTRFAPSPTGFLHVGGVRTALYSWLFAKHHHGEFILRIEDTDETRSTSESVDAILSGMTWLSLSWDDGPFYQTDRYPRYRELAEQLLKEGKAYYCTCSKERLEGLRDEQMQAKQKPRYDGHCRERQLEVAPHDAYVIRFKNPKTGTVNFTDQVYGDIEVQNSELDDLILIRSDGNPTYNYAVVVDDWDMQITHVIRGDDHLSNTPRQINLYHALNAPVPIFAHLPMILGEDGKRLSKRHGAVSVLQFRELGILPHALLNYLVRLGWSHQDQEIFSLEEMIQLFDLSHVSRGVSSFNYDKLFWLNQHYQKHTSAEEVAQSLRWCFEQAHVNLSQGPSLVDLVKLQAERHKTLVDIVKNSLYFYQDELTYDEPAIKKHLTPTVREPLLQLLEGLSALQVWDATAIHYQIDTVCQTHQLGMGKIAQPLRLAVTGGTSSPSIDQTLVLIGKHRSLERLKLFLEKF